MIEYVLLLPPIMMVICSITLAAYVELHLRTVKLGLTSFAFVLTVSYLCLLRKASILRYSRNLTKPSLLSVHLLSGPTIRMQLWPTCEQLVVGSFSFNGNQNRNVPSKAFLAYFILVVLFLGLSESSFIEASMSENSRLYQTKEFLATRLLLLGKHRYTRKN